MKKYSIILAAGKGTRMESDLPKCGYPILRKPMVEYIIDQMDKSDIDRSLVIVGHKGEVLQGILKDRVDYAWQTEQLGTGHAVLQAKEYFKDKKDSVVFIMPGDVPLITKDLIDKLLNAHLEMGNDLTLLSMKVDNPKGYGRILRDEYRQVIGIIEENDADEIQKQINEVNTGVYAANTNVLFEALEKIELNERKQEFYLTDIVKIMNRDYKVNTMLSRNTDETMGVNDLIGVSFAEQYIREKVNREHMQKGVSIINPETVTLGEEVVLERGVVIYPNTTITGKTLIKSGARIGPNTELHNAKIGNLTEVRHSLITNSEVGDNTTVGPFAQLRDKAIIGNNCRIGNFVEVKNSTLGDDTKAAHLAYIGDSIVGRNVNFGSGSITVNFDGVLKHKTIIGDNVFIGCNVNLVAPINIGDNVFLAAGSTVTEDVPTGSLAIARNRQINKEDYASNLIRANETIEKVAQKETKDGI